MMRCVPFVFIWPNCLVSLATSAFRLKAQREVEGRAKTENISLNCHANLSWFVGVEIKNLFPFNVGKAKQNGVSTIM